MKTIYYGGQVYTGEMPLREAFIEENGKFVFAGMSADALKMEEAGDKCINLQGKFVCAGFNDSHMHALSYGNSLRNAKLGEHTDSLEGMILYFREFLETHPVKEGAFLIGRGWNQDYFSDADRMPNRYDLDRVSGDIPVIAVRCCGHALVVNSKVIEMLGVTKDTVSPEGGSIGIENGEPDGRFFDNAMDQVYDLVPAPGEEEILDMMKAAMKSLNGYGITSCHSDDYGAFSGSDWRTVKRTFEKLEKSGEMTVRVYEQSNFTDIDSLRAFVEEGNTTGKGSDMFKTGPLKMLGDGALGARTAYLTKPYADAPDTIGLGVFDQKTMDEMIGYAHKNGMQVAVHAIGDACLDSVLSAVGKAIKECPREDHRHGIVHCQITRPDQLDTIAEMNMHVYAQAIFIDYDSHIVYDRVGKALADASYNWKTLMKKGVTVSNGTDCPVELPDALKCMQMAVTRKSMDGIEYLPHEAFTVQEALDSYTKNSAHASFDETVKGQIAPGMLADFVILEKSPFDVNAEEIHRIRVLKTYVGGKNVFDADNQS